MSIPVHGQDRHARRTVAAPLRGQAAARSTHRRLASDILLAGFALACAVVVMATEDAPRLVPPVVSYAAFAAGAGDRGVAEPSCPGPVRRSRCR